MSLLAQLRDADRALVRTVDAMPDDAFAQPSLLPGWSRAHVVAHLALNAEALAGVVLGVTGGEPVSMYSSQEARDDDIAVLGSTRPGELRERLLGAVGTLGSRLDNLPDDVCDVAVERVPGGGRTFLVGEIDDMRLREVEIHHADLGLDRTHDDWPPAFARLLLEALAASRGRSPEFPPCIADAVDLDARWHFGPGDGGPQVTGSGAALGWWLAGRGDGEGLTSDGGTLPQIPEW